MPNNNIAPFFTLVESKSGDIHHPTVHYVFQDDEQLTSLAVDQLEGKQRRVVVVDTDGKTVKQVTSLSHDWQAVQAKIQHAPTFGHAGKDALMLTITGVEEHSAELPANATLDDLIAAFDKEMVVLESGVCQRAGNDTNDMLQKWDHS